MTPENLAKTRNLENVEKRDGSHQMDLWQKQLVVTGYGWSL